MVPEELRNAESQLPKHIYVDLDGTLTPCDTLWEQVARLIRRKPFYLLLLPFVLLRGRARFKSSLIQWTQVNVATLPFRTALVSWLQSQQTAGRRVILATASHDLTAHAVVKHLGLDGYLATDQDKNLKGAAKADAVKRHANGEPFVYVGDSSADIPVWREATVAIAINNAKDLNRANTENRHNWLFEQHSLRHAVRALRPHHWAKNALLFVPLITAHQFVDWRPWLACAVAFLSFSFMSSAVYLVNDLMDLEADRQHPRKKNRPLAQGSLSIPIALVLTLAVFLTSAGLAYFLPLGFGQLLALYAVMTTLYSLAVKQIVVIDTITLAALFTMRVLAGGAASGTPISPWLLAFSMFVFLSLAMLKRYIELITLKEQDAKAAAGRGYLVGDAPMVAALGVANGSVSVLVLALYVNSPEVALLYANPMGIWLICPALIYWLSRLWMRAHRSQMHDDPLVFAFSDPVSYAVGIFVLAVMWLAL
ncbi:MAG: UbiA family prenyltransferase [Acidobacteria bacterium]|nr:UbiA family prenyltransferase [Acidobacteriota bacterium]